MRASASLFFPDLRPREGWPQRSTRVKLAVMLGIGSIAICGLLVIFLLKGFESSYWEWTASRGISRTTAMVALYVSWAIIPVTGILVYRGIERFGPDARIAAVDHLFTAFHWAAFIALLAIAIQWLSHIRSGDAGGLLALSITLAIIPLRIGWLRPLGCLLIAIVSALVFAMRPDSGAAVVMACCIFSYASFPWLEAARVSAQNVRQRA